MLLSDAGLIRRKPLSSNDDGGEELQRNTVATCFYVSRLQRVKVLSFMFIIIIFLKTNKDYSSSGSRSSRITRSSSISIKSKYQSRERVDTLWWHQHQGTKQKINLYQECFLMVRLYWFSPAAQTIASHWSRCSSGAAASSLRLTTIYETKILILARLICFGNVLYFLLSFICVSLYDSCISNA